MTPSLRTIVVCCGLPALGWLAGACGEARREVLFDVERAIVPVHVPKNSIEPELMPLYDAFFADAATYGRPVDRPDKLQIVFIGDVQANIEGEVGFCTQKWVDRKFSGTHLEIDTIEIARSLTRAPLAMRRTLYHELGHCLLGLEHADAKMPDSIMAEDFSAGWDLDESVWSQLVEELMQTY